MSKEEEQRQQRKRYLFYFLCFFFLCLTPALTTLQCGGVVLAQLNGDLTLPFRDLPTDCTPTINPPSSGRAPAYFVDDLEDFLRIPGRYSVSIQVRDQ